MNPINITISVASLVNCNELDDDIGVLEPDILRAQTFVGCKVLQILKEMYQFETSYVYGDWRLNMSASEIGADVYVRPMSISSEILDYLHPIFPVYTWRFGFTLMRPEEPLRAYYSLPFTRRVWNCLYAMVILVSLLFFMLHKWEQRITKAKNECSIGYELLVAIAGYCQHVLPVQAFMSSRRLAYTTFFLFTYVIYAFYASHLLCHLVNDRAPPMEISTLVNSNYDLVLLEETKVNLTGRIPLIRNWTRIAKKLSRAGMTNVLDALNAVKLTNTAVLSDYISLRPFMTQVFKSDEICQLIEVDIFTNVNKYFYTAKGFKYREQFKRGILQAKEAGLLQRYKPDFAYAPLCASNRHIFQATSIKHIIFPILTLGCIHCVSVIILLCERVYYERNKVFPYVE